MTSMHPRVPSWLYAHAWMGWVGLAGGRKSLESARGGL
jgi:hypothetical protein